MSEEKYNLLKEREDNWVTDLGAWFMGERVVFHGKDLFTDLFEEHWISIWYQSVTGTRFEQRQLDLWSRLWALCVSYPEPRIWNNRVAALAGTAKSTGFLAIAAGTALSDSRFFGGHAQYAATEFIIRAKKHVVDEGENLENFIANEIRELRGIPPGFGRPVVNSDERIPPAKKVAEELGFMDGPHVQLALKIDALLLKNRYRVQMNIGGFTAALAADQGMTPRDFYLKSTVIYSAGLIACYQDAMNKPAGTFFPLQCNRIAYAGNSPRKWENNN